MVCFYCPRALACLACVVLASAPSMVLSQKKKPDAGTEAKQKEAREHYQKGITHYNLGEFEAAILEFKQAYAISNAHGLLFNIAQAYRLGGDAKQGLYFYKTYLRLVPEAPNRADVESRIAELEQALKEQEKAKLQPPPLPTPTTQTPQPVTSPPTPPPTTTSPPPSSPAMPQAAPSPIAPTIPPARTVAKAGSSASPGETVVTKTPAVTTPLRRRRLGALVRADIDGKLRGWMPVLGATLAVGPHMEVTAATLLGAKARGVWLGGSYLMGHGPLRPLAFVGAPLFFTPVVAAGVQAGAGVQWDLSPRLGLFLHASIAHFLKVPTDQRVPFDKTIFIPALGIQGRL